MYALFHILLQFLKNILTFWSVWHLVVSFLSVQTSTDSEIITHQHGTVDYVIENKSEWMIILHS